MLLIDYSITLCIILRINCNKKYINIHNGIKHIAMKFAVPDERRIDALLLLLLCIQFGSKQGFPLCLNIHFQILILYENQRKKEKWIQSNSKNLTTEIPFQISNIKLLELIIKWNLIVLNGWIQFEKWDLKRNNLRICH